MQACTYFIEHRNRPGIDANTIGFSLSSFMTEYFSVGKGYTELFSSRTLVRAETDRHSILL